jgi:hypothetical protein
MKYGILLISFFFAANAFGQAYRPDFKKPYPFPDAATPFVFQKKKLPTVYSALSTPPRIIQDEEIPQEDMAVPPPMEVLGTVGDTIGETVQQRIYRKRPSPSDWYSNFMHEGKWGSVRNEKDTIFPAKYDRIEKVDNFFLVQKGEKFGVFDAQGGQVSDFIWHWRSSIQGLILLQAESKAVVFNSAFDTVFSIKADSAEFAYSINEALPLYRFKQNGQWKLYDLYQGKLIDGYFDNYRHFGNSTFAAAKDEQWWLFSLDGKLLYPEPFENVWFFSNKYREVMIGSQKLDGYKKQYFLLNGKGKRISAIYDRISEGDLDNYAWARIFHNGKHGMIDYTGNVIAPPVYDRIVFTYKDSFELYQEEKLVGILSNSTGKIAKPPVNK